MRSGEHGLFLVNGITAHLRFNKDDVTRPLHRTRSWRRKQKQSIKPIRFDQIDFAAMTERERTAFLVSNHEYHHFQTLLGTPLGLLMWRTTDVVLRGVGYCCGQFQEAGLKTFPRDKPLVDWLKSDGLTYLDKSLKSGWIPGGVQKRRGRLPANFDVRRVSLDKMADLARELDVVNRFYRELFVEPKSGLTIGEFIELADAAFYYLSERHLSDGVTPGRAMPKWTSNYPTNQKLYPAFNWCLGVPELLEGGARLYERQLLDTVKNGRDFVPAWEKESLFGIYAPAYRFLSENLGNVTMGAAANLIAMMTPIDVRSFFPSEERIYVEDVIPCYRLARLLKAFNREVASQSRTAHFWDAWLSAAGLRTVTNTLGILLQNHLLHPNAIPASEGSEIDEAFRTSDSKSHIEHISRQFQRGFSRNLNTFSATASVMPKGIGETDRPDIEFFQDTVSLNNRHLGLSVLGHLGTLTYCIVSEASLALLTAEKQMAHPGAMFETFRNRLYAEVNDDVDKEIIGALAFMDTRSPEKVIQDNLQELGLRSLTFYATPSTQPKYSMSI